MGKKLSFDERSNMYHEEFDSYLIELLKEIIPMQLVKLKEYNLMLKSESLEQHVNSITDIFNICFDYNDDFPLIRNEVEKILKDKYGYIIKQDTPLIMEKVNNK